MRRTLVWPILVLLVGTAIYWFSSNEPPLATRDPAAAAASEHDGDDGDVAAPRGREASDAPARRDVDDSSEPDEERRFRVVGSVTFTDGRPALHAAVWTFSDATGSVMTETRAGGQFEMSLPAGEYTLSARHERTGTACASVVVTPSDRTTDAPPLVLDEGASITGRVFRSDGTPAAEIRVRAFAETGSNVQFFTDSGTSIQVGGDDVLSDSDGFFRLVGLDAGVPHTVAVSLFPRTDLKAEPKEAKGVLPGGAPLQFVVRPDRWLAGRVVDARSKRPIRWFQIDGRPFDDARGEFGMSLDEHAPPRFEALGYETLERLDLALKEGETRAGIVVEMEPTADAGSLRLTVQDDVGRPVPAFVVRTREVAYGDLRENTLGRWSRKVSSADGIITIDPIAAGGHRLVVSADGHAPDDVDAQVVAGEATDVVVTLLRAAPVRLRVVDADETPWGGDVAVVNDEGVGPPWRFLPDHPRGTLLRVTEFIVPRNERGPSRAQLDPAEGRLVDLPPGRYTLLVHYEADPVAVPFDVFAEAPIDLVVRPPR